MAIYTAIVTGGNWSDNATWGGSGHPIAGDTVNIDYNGIVVDVTSICANLNTTGAITITLSADLTITNDFNCVKITIDGPYGFHCQGNVITSNTNGINGSSTLYLDGGNNQSLEPSTTYLMLRIDTIINKSGGILQLPSKNTYFSYNVNKTLTYVAGTTDANGGTFIADVTSTINANGILFYNFSLRNTYGGCTLTSALQVSNNLLIGTGTTLTCSGNNVTIGGNFTNNGTYTCGNNTTIFNGISILTGSTIFYNLTINAGKTVSLTSTQTFTVSNNLSLLGTSVNIIILNATIPTSKAIFTVTNGFKNANYVLVTDIDSSGGNSVKGVHLILNNTDNWTNFLAILKRWNGSSWLSSKLEYYNGIIFVNATLKMYNGSWITVLTQT